MIPTPKRVKNQPATHTVPQAAPAPKKWPKMPKPTRNPK